MHKGPPCISTGGLKYMEELPPPSRGRWESRNCIACLSDQQTSLRLGNLICTRISNQWLPKLFLVCQITCPADIQCSAWHFDSLPDILLSDVQQMQSFLPDILCTFVCRTFLPRCPLLDKMSGSAWTLCRTFQNHGGHVQHVRHIWRSLFLIYMSIPYLIETSTHMVSMYIFNNSW